jgi:hypothetical protein
MIGKGQRLAASPEASLVCWKTNSKRPQRLEYLARTKNTQVSHTCWIPSSESHGFIPPYSFPPILSASSGGWDLVMLKERPKGLRLYVVY